MIHRLKFNRFAGWKEPRDPEQYAAVAILIYKNKEILFIKRSENMPTHKGDIAFPGGKKEDGDMGIYSTAKREAYEELLIPKKTVSSICTVEGNLDPIDTVEYKFNVYPVVFSLYEKQSNFNKDEVQKIFYEPIEKLINKNNWSYRGAYDDDWIYMLDDEILWGATAKMVRTLCDLRLR